MSENNLFNYYAFYYEQGIDEPRYRKVTDDLTEEYIQYTETMVNALKCEKAIIVDSEGNVQRIVLGVRNVA